MPEAGEDSGGVRAYRGPGEHLGDWLVRLRLMIQRHLVLFTDRFLDSSGKASDLFASRREVEAFLAMEPPGPDVLESLRVIEESLDRFQRFMAARLAASAETGMRLPIEDLRAAFGLDDLEMDLLMALAAPDLDPEFARAYSHAWADFARRHVDGAFLADLVAGLGPDRDRVWAALQPGARLRRMGLVEAGMLPDLGPMTRGSDRPLKAADRVVAWIRGHRESDRAVLGRAAGWYRRDDLLGDLLLPASVRRAVQEALRRQGPDRRLRGIVLVGAVGSGRRSLALETLGEQGRPLLVVRLDRLPAAREDREGAVRGLVREALLLGAAIYLEGVEDLDRGGTGPGTGVLDDLFEALEDFPGPLLVGATVSPREILRPYGEFQEIGVPFPEASDQQRLWERGLSRTCRKPPGFAIPELVGRYSLSGGAIEACCRAVGRWAETAGARSEALPLPVVVDAIRAQLSHRLSAVAIPVHKGEGWDDLVLPPRTLDTLREIVQFFRNRSRILHEWGLGAKLLKTPGVPCLFAGPPGTGKTMAASIIAKELGREIFQIDLSRVVDKYIGETEKNLGRAFEEGARAQAVLLFDEADSLFAKRTDVKTSVDRYANLEVNYLLQRIESYEGIAILTTNFPGSIDEAFRRRLRFFVEFPFPEEAERLRLWQTLMPPEVPLGPDVDLREMARRYLLAGGNIRNVIIRAATLAAEADRPVDMALMVQAANTEYRAIGKLVREEVES
ncbi:ATP-binding protein [Myxococcota bacterium]|nr:ATP-binding protein [Myxococcota bacterium]